MEEKKSITLKNDVAQIDRLTAFIEECGNRFGLKADVVFNMTLAMEEMASNVMMYAYPDGREHEFDVEFVKESDRLVFTIKDDGIPFDPTAVPDADITLSAEERGIGGLGILMTRRIMDSIEYQRTDGMNILTMTKYLNKEG